MERVELPQLIELFREGRIVAEIDYNPQYNEVIIETPSICFIFWVNNEGKNKFHIVDKYDLTLGKNKLFDRAYRYLVDLNLNVIAYKPFVAKDDDGNSHSGMQIFICTGKHLLTLELYDDFHWYAEVKEGCHDD